MVSFGKSKLVYTSLIFVDTSQNQWAYQYNSRYQQLQQLLPAWSILYLPGKQCSGV